LSKLTIAAVAAVVAVVCTLLIAGLSSRSLWASLGMGLAVWLLVGSATEWADRVGLFRRSWRDAFHRAMHLPRSAYGMTISHMGLAIVLIGITGSVAWKTEYLQVMHPGDSAAIAGYQVKFIGVEDNLKGPNYVAARGTFIVTRNGRYVSTLEPERRVFTIPPQPLSTVAIHTNFVSDVYVVLGDPSEGGDIVHIYHNPMVPWLFFGAVVMVLGGIVALTDRHHRIGAPLRRLGETIRRTAATVAPTSAAPPARSRAHPSWRYLAPLAVFVVLFGFLVCRLYLVEQGFAPNLIPSVLVNKSAPRFDLPPLLANEAGFRTADLRGRVTLVNFFASWCGPCREEHPFLPEVARAGIVLIGVDYEDRPQDARAWLAELGDPYKTVAVDAHGRTGIDFGVYGVPESYLIDKKGVIRFKQTGPLTRDIIENQLIPLAEKLNK
jgi:cytochrome c-type biogenesis protein CcmF